MVDWNNVFGVQANVGQLQVQRAEVNALGGEDFLKLLVTQMNQQNPCGTNDGVQNKECSLANLSSTLQSNQALQASALVGRQVLVPADNINLTQVQSVSGTVGLPQGTPDLKISIFNQQGALVNQLSVGQQASGEIKFTWNGHDAQGNPVTPGQYQIKAQANIDNQTVALSTNLLANVDSVSLGGGSGGLQLNVAGIGARNLSDIRQYEN